MDALHRALLSSYKTNLLLEAFMTDHQDLQYCFTLSTLLFKYASISTQIVLGVLSKFMAWSTP